MSNELDRRYFDVLARETKGETEYLSVRPIGNPIVLFSKVDGSPLAAFHVRCQDNYRQNDRKENRGRALITRRPYKSTVECDFSQISSERNQDETMTASRRQVFQGLIDRDNQEFEFVITNLSSGMIDFNILQTNSKVEMVNPGGVNQVNELRSMESYAVQCDQKDNRTMILRAIKKETADKRDVKLTVQEAEDICPERPQGSYYYLSVVPQVNKADLVAQFKETVWESVDCFVLKRPAQTWCTRGTPSFRDRIRADEGARPEPMFYAQSRGDESFHPARCTFGYSASRGVDRLDGLTECFTRGDSIDSLMENSRGLTLQSAGAPSASIRTASLSRGSDSHSERIRSFRETCTSRMDHAEIDCIEECAGTESPRGSSPNNEMFDGDVDDFTVLSESSVTQDKSGATQRDAEDASKINARKKGMSKGVTDDVIKESFAAQVVGGEHVTVYSSETDYEYNYETPSAPCVVCLSVSERLQFRSPPEDAVLICECAEIIKDMLENANKGLLEKLSRVYEEDKCTICLDGKEDERPNDAVFYACGHQCTHYECAQSLNKCPLCRKSITASIKV